MKKIKFLLLIQYHHFAVLTPQAYTDFYFVSLSISSFNLNLTPCCFEEKRLCALLKQHFECVNLMNKETENERLSE
jgi:hypothetical protein